MAITSGFYDSVNGDRKYNSNQISSLFEGIINDGVFASIGTSLVVTASAGMTVNVGKGRAWFNQTWTNNDAVYPVVVSASEMALNRIDAVVLEVNTNADVRANSIKIVKGVPASVPANPGMTRTEYINQYPLCYIYVGAGVTVINQANITNLVGTASCPFITGILQTMTVEGVTALLESEFNAWFDNIQAQLAGDVAGNLQNQINDLEENKTDSTDVRSIIRETEASSYIAFCTNANAGALDAAFGKLNETFISSIGKQLAMYAWFKGASKITYPFTSLITKNSLSDIFSDPISFSEYLSSSILRDLILLSPYALGVYNAAYPGSVSFTKALAILVGLDPDNYAGVPNTIFSDDVFLKEICKNSTASKIFEPLAQNGVVTISNTLAASALFSYNTGTYGTVVLGPINGFFFPQIVDSTSIDGYMFTGVSSQGLIIFGIDSANCPWSLVGACVALRGLNLSKSGGSFTCTMKSYTVV